MLRGVALRVTRPRVAVLSAVHDHPHADTDSIVRLVREDLGRVSQQAVYNVLHALTVAGLLRRIQPSVVVLMETELWFNFIRESYKSGARIAVAIAVIDASPYGLLTSVFTQDLRRGLRFAEAARAGWVNVNESSNYWESHLPFGGRAGSRSGIGRVGGRHPFDTFTETKTVIVEI